MNNICSVILSVIALATVLWFQPPNDNHGVTPLMNRTRTPFDNLNV